jgi:hypothetical protein
MRNTVAIVSEEEQLVLSTLSPGVTQRRLAFAVVLGLLIVFVLITFGPLSSVRMQPFAAFVPAYATAMFVCDSITSILLFAQFSILRSRAILVIASGYLFTALILIPWILAFPGVLVPTSLMGGLHSTAWLYAVWHGGFALFVLGYALSKDAGRHARSVQGTNGVVIARSVAGTAVLVLAAGTFCIAGEALVPPIMLDPSRFSPLWPYAVAGPVALLCLCALTVLWRRGRSVLDHG